MKRIFLALTISSLAAVTIPCQAYSQKSQADSNRPLRSELAVTSIHIPGAPADLKTPVYNEISTRAVRDFKKFYKNVHTERWQVSAKSILATFWKDDTKYRVTYNKNGLWLHTILYYSEKQLPKDVRAIVKSTYYDHAIIQVEEVHYKNDIIYVVHLEDEKGWMNVSVCNGEMGILEKFEKLK